ncbi:conserved hypothetical protein [Vibrio phage 424E50-1]|nr:conserved hypothetical protein [Vibrio phage 424E50-1]
MLTNKQIASQLEKAIENSKVSYDRIENINGFDVVVGQVTEVDAQRLQDRLEALISILKEE